MTDKAIELLRSACAIANRKGEGTDWDEFFCQAHNELVRHAGAPGPLSYLATEIREINTANGWNVFKIHDWQDDYRVPAIISLIHSEASEALEGFRADDLDNVLEECADIIIRVLDFVGGLTPDFDSVVQAKLDKNRQRGYKHGGKRI